MRKDPNPLMPPWLMNPPRWILWRVLLFGIACIQVLLIFSGGWTTRHSISFPVFIAAVVVLHPVLKKRLPIFCLDILRSWRTYVAIALIVVVNLIESTQF